MPKNIDWGKLQDFEKEDNTKGSQELACTAGVCELVDMMSKDALLQLMVITMEECGELVQACGLSGKITIEIINCLKKR